MTARRKNNPWEEQFSFEFEHPGIAPAAATTLITCTTNANMADTDFFTLNDGFRFVVYEYDKSANGVTAGRVQWVAGAGTAAQSAATLKTAIEANQPAFTVVDNLDGTLTLTNRWLGAGGNITQPADNVANAAFILGNSSGGLDAGSHNATYTKKLMTAQRKMRVDKVEYVNPTGLAGHASNYWEIALKKGSTVMAQWSTDSDVATQGTLTANAIVNPALSATDGELVAAAGDVLSLALTKFASAANLPAGRLIVHGRYVA
jgi:hypothetical protein